MRVIRASVASGTSLVILFQIYFLMRNWSSVEFPGVLVGLIYASIPVWILGTAFALVLLIPMKPLAENLKSQLSLPLFLIVGFIVAALFMYEMLQARFHGDPSAVETQELSYIVLRTIEAGILGAVSALASWLSIRKTQPSNDT